jgi:cation transporter-like permease
MFGFLPLVCLFAAGAIGTGIKLLTHQALAGVASTVVLMPLALWMSRTILRRVFDPQAHTTDQVTPNG